MWSSPKPQSAMRNESFTKSLFAVGAGTIINLAIGFFTTPIITRLVNPTEYGQFSIFTMYTNLVLMVLCLGMDQSLVRFYYKSDRTEDKKRLVFECAVLPVAITVVFLAVALILVYFGVISFEFNWFITIILAVNIIVNVLFRFSTLIVRLNRQNRLYAYIQVVHKFIYVALALLFLLVLKIGGIYSLAIATVLSLTVCIAVALFSQRAYVPGIGDKMLLQKQELIVLIRYGFPFIFSMGITSLFQSLDKLSLNHYSTYNEVGIYASAMTFVTLFSVVQTSFNTVWAPRAVEHYEKKPEDKKYYSTVFDTISVVMFGIGVALILFKDVFALLLGEKYREASYIMPFLIFQPIMYTVSESTVVGITFAKKSSLHLVIAAGACLTNYIGNTLLVPALGCRGAAMSTGISYIVFFTLRTVLAEKNYKIGFNVMRFSIVTLIVIGYAAYNTFFSFNILSVAFALICYMALFILYKDNVKWLGEKCKKQMYSFFSSSRKY